MILFAWILSFIFKILQMKIFKLITININFNSFIIFKLFKIEEYLLWIYRKNYPIQKNLIDFLINCLIVYNNNLLVLTMIKFNYCSLTLIIYMLIINPIIF